MKALTLILSIVATFACATAPAIAASINNSVMHTDICYAPVDRGDGVIITPCEVVTIASMTDVKGMIQMGVQFVDGVRYVLYGTNDAGPLAAVLET